MNSRSFKIIAKTGDLGLNTIENSPSINDAGTVAFVGTTSSTSTTDIFAGNALQTLKDVTGSTNSAPNSTRALQLNNVNSIVTHDFRLAANFSVVSGIRVRDTNNPGTFTNTATTPGSSYELIFSQPSINNKGDVVFSAKQSTTTFLATRLNSTPVKGPVRPMIADSGDVVVRFINPTDSTQQSIRLYNQTLQQFSDVATTSMGFTALGLSPGISDEGKILTFYGELSSTNALELPAGPGIFASIKTTGGKKLVRIAGVTNVQTAGNGFIDPGESWNDTNNNGKVENGEDIGFASFQNAISGDSNTRIGVSSGLTTTYFAVDQSGNEGIYTSRITWSDINNNNKLDVTEEIIVSSPTLVSKAGSTLPGLTGNTTDLEFYDPINNSDQVAFWVQTNSGQQAIVRADTTKQPLLFTDKSLLNKLLGKVGIGNTQIQAYSPHLVKVMQKFGITSAQRIQAFIAQTAHESLRFTRIEEIASGAQYEGRIDLGNTKPGDGIRFKGRGLIQITGRTNYTRAEAGINSAYSQNYDLTPDPGESNQDSEQVATDPFLATAVSGWFWDQGPRTRTGTVISLNPLADVNNLREITRLINGGYNGYEDRLQNYSKAKNAVPLLDFYNSPVADSNSTTNTSLLGTGTSGYDDLFGGAGGDTLRGDQGDDYLNGGLDNDSLIGGLGHDDLFGSSGNDTLRGELGNDYLDGGSENDSLIGEDGADLLFGQDGTDDLDGGNGNDDLVGGRGNDTLIGGLNDDYLFGQDGIDNLNGGTGTDFLAGGRSNDILTGGVDSVRDKFVYDTAATFTTASVGVDTINNFGLGSDKIVLDKQTFRALTSNPGTGFSVAREFAVVATDLAAATSIADIVYSSVSDNLFYNQNGAVSGFGTGAQFATVTGITSLAAMDFLIQA